MLVCRGRYQGLSVSLSGKVCEKGTSRIEQKDECVAAAKALVDTCCKKVKKIPKKSKKGKKFAKGCSIKVGKTKQKTKLVWNTGKGAKKGKKGYQAVCSDKA